MLLKILKSSSDCLCIVTSETVKNNDHTFLVSLIAGTVFCSSGYRMKMDGDKKGKKLGKVTIL